MKAVKSCPFSPWHMHTPSAKLATWDLAYLGWDKDTQV